jgi:exonuclease SbcC
MRIALEKKYLLETEWNKANNKYNLQKEQLEQHRSEFMWSDIEMGNIEQFYQLKEKAIAANKIVEELEESYIQEQKEAEQIKTNVEKYREALRKIEIEYAKLESEVYTKKSQIRFLDIDDLALISLEEVELKIKNTEKHIENIEIEYKKFQQLYQELSLKLTAFQTEKRTISVEISELKQNIDNIEKELTPLMEKFQLNSKDEIFNILLKKINVEETRKIIQAFVVSHEVIKNNVATLTDKLKLVDLDENKYKEKEKEVTELEQKVEEQAIFTTKLSGELERLERDLKEKGNLLLKFEEIDKRLKNIAVLENMFKGAGFVNYVSAVYLKNLCNAANHRFHRLTNNQLSLQLNDNNEFEIIDYLNGGKSRSVKTLSGGQSFQVSLSLALALAENVQSSSKADKSFFFIDEGFGTQDKDSVNIVFETLNSLYKENKIVGIISHVDELKEKIPVSISVVKDEDQGSLVLY